MKHMVSSALFAGFAAGLLCALLQYLLVEPKILLAERYESGELVHFQGVPSETSSHDAMPGMTMPAAEAAGHDHDHGAGEETSAAMRHLLTVLFTVLTYCGYGLVLIAGIQLAEGMGLTLGPAQGLLWGLAGFLAFQLMPALGLEPELPGTPAADLNARQIWWVATAVCTVIGLWFTAYGTALWQRALGIVVLVAPHVWGAPELEGFGGVVPPELASSFAARSLAVGLVTWAVLGGLTLKFWQQEPAK
jgi:cobalt transporter subunit CbtA